jgi:DNA-binding NarL/FixJ family response regulator
MKPVSAPTVVIIAAGEGTRMRSSLPKVLHPVCGRPIVNWAVTAALDAGAAGYLLKDTTAARLPYAVRGVAEGEAALSRKLTARVLDEFRGRAQRRRLPLPHQHGVDLTSREWEVLELMRQELSTAEIAKRLFVSPVTVRTHVAALLRKLNVPDRRAAIELLEDR